MGGQISSLVLICLLSIYSLLVNDSAAQINLLETSRYYFSPASSVSNDVLGNAEFAGAGEKHDDDYS